MKLFCSAILVILAISILPACKKCYACTYPSGNNADYCKNHPYSQSELDQIQVGCEQGGGVWGRANL